MTELLGYMKESNNCTKLVSVMLSIYSYNSCYIYCLRQIVGNVSLTCDRGRQEM